MMELVLALALGSPITSKEELTRYVNNTTALFIEQHKKRFRLTYEGEPEKPTIIFWYLPDQAGTCDMNTGIIVLDTDDLVSDEVRKVERRRTENVERHELLHFNNYKIRKRLKIGYDGTLPERIVEEGGAEYMANTMTGQLKKCVAFRDLEQNQYEKVNAETGDVDSSLIYDVGACVTGPVIEKYGEEGIIYMMEHLPTEEEIKSPYAYRARIMKELAEQSKK